MAKILFLKKIGMATMTYIMMYSIMATYQVFFYQEVKTTVEDLEYIPKSKRNPFWKWINPTKTWLIDKMCIIEENVMARITLSLRHHKLQRAYINTKRSQKKASQKYCDASICRSCHASKRFNCTTKQGPI